MQSAVETATLKSVREERPPLGADRRHERLARCPERGRLSFTFLGFLVSLIGIILTYRQARGAKSAAEEARKAADRAVRESQRRFRQYAAFNAKRFLTEAEHAVAGGQWATATLRLEDLADNLSQLTREGADPSGTLGQEARSFGAHCRKQVGLNTPELIDEQKWLKFLLETKRSLDDWLGLYSPEGGHDA